VSEYLSRFYLVVGFSIVALLWVGCSNSKEPTGPPRYETHGTVTYRGKPVGKAEVVFFAPSLGISRGATTNEEGYFRIVASSGVGLPEGEYRVAVRQAPGGDLEILDEFRKDIPRKYMDEKTSGLKFQIGQGENKLEIDLTDN